MPKVTMRRGQDNNYTAYAVHDAFISATITNRFRLNEIDSVISFYKKKCMFFLLLFKGVQYGRNAAAAIILAKVYRVRKSAARGKYYRWTSAKPKWQTSN